MKLSAISAVALMLPLCCLAGCSSDGGDSEPLVDGDPGEPAALIDDKSSSIACSSENASTPECSRMAADIQAAVDDLLGPDDGVQVSDDSDLLENTGSGSGSGGSGSGSGGGKGSGSGSGSGGGKGSGSGSGSGSGAGSGSGSPAAQSVSTTRHAIIARAQKWVADKVMYSQSKYHEGYRQDCSGFVSMAWQISKNLNTASFAPYSHAQSSQLSDYNQLLPGDALNMQPREHMFLFAGWANSAHTSMYIYEESHTGAPALYKAVGKSYFGHFVPIRRKGL